MKYLKYFETEGDFDRAYYGDGDEVPALIEYWFDEGVIYGSATYVYAGYNETTGRYRWKCTSNTDEFETASDDPDVGEDLTVWWAPNYSQGMFHAGDLEKSTVVLRNSSTYEAPWLSYTVGKGVDYDGYAGTPFTVEALESGQITWNLGNMVLRYSKNGGEWTTMTEDTTITVVQGDEVAFMGPNESYYDYDANTEYNMEVTAQFNAKGNIMSILNHSSRVGDYALYRFFYNCYETLISAEHLVLPAKVLGERCYAYMFNECTNLTTAPELPATDLGTQCYECMFCRCTGLTEAPVLPARNLADGCYSYMFQYCSGLTEAPALPATELKSSCYSGMFYGCTGLTSAPTLPAMNLADGCYSNMFNSCTSLTSAPALPATKAANYCYNYMFISCGNLVTPPDMHLETTADSCCYYMFGNCSHMTTAPELPAVRTTPGCYSFMFSYCTSLTVAPALPATNATQSCYSNMFLYCTGLTAAPELPATTVENNCYSNMFKYCSGLTTAPTILPAETMDYNSYSGMFYGCINLTAAPELPATTLATSCYSSMFYGCSNLTTAPELPAETLVSNCYNQMFRNCSRLNYIKVMFTTTPADAYTKNWVSGVASSGTYVKRPNAYYSTRGVSAIPNNWTIESSW